MNMGSCSVESAAQDLLVPAMGTEALGPWLYWFVRFTRPSTVLEAGAGYTTPFLAAALARNVHDVHDEQLLLNAKTKQYIADVVQLKQVPEPQNLKPRARGLSALYQDKS